MISDNDRQPELPGVPQTWTDLIEQTMQKEIGMCRRAQEEITSRVVDKLDAMIRSHALHTEDRILEKYLRKMEEDTHSKVRWIIAKFISEKLNRAFTKDNLEVLKLFNVGYAGHAQLFEQLVYEAKDIYLTCKFHPKEWFERLRGRPSGTYNSSKPAKIWYNYCNGEEYPSHFLQFLNNPRNGKRIRIFLMDPENWRGLENEREDARYFLKFIGPCEENYVQTFFINLDEAIGSIKGALYNVPIPGEIDPEDYDVFDQQAVVTYREYPNEEDELELRIGDIRDYIKVFDTILSRQKGMGKGIYDVREISKKLGITIE